MRVRDLALAGRRADLVWRKRRFRCQPCGRTFTEQHPELPSRQRLTRRFRGRLLERVRGGAAHAEVAGGEGATRHQVARAFRDGARERAAPERRPPRWLSLDEAHHRRGRELATVVAEAWGLKESFGAVYAAPERAEPSGASTASWPPPIAHSSPPSRRSPKRPSLARGDPRLLR